MEVVNALVDAVRHTPSVRLLDHSSDTAHNRSVLTVAGDATSLKAAVVALFEAALPRIDLRQHTGEHPRLGAVDVMPVRPDCGGDHGRMRAAGQRDGGRSRGPVSSAGLLVEEASGNPARKNLEDIRRGEFEGLEAKMSAQAGHPISDLLDRIPQRARPSWVPACR